MFFSEITNKSYVPRENMVPSRFIRLMPPNVAFEVISFKEVVPSSLMRLLTTDYISMYLAIDHQEFDS